jgi:hypothetical protein
MNPLMVGCFDRMSAKLVLVFAKEMSEADVPVDPYPHRTRVVQELKTKFETKRLFSRVMQELKTKFAPTCPFFDYHFSMRARVPFQFHPPCHLGLREPSV